MIHSRCELFLCTHTHLLLCEAQKSCVRWHHVILFWKLYFCVKLSLVHCAVSKSNRESGCACRIFNLVNLQMGWVWGLRRRRICALLFVCSIRWVIKEMVAISCSVFFTRSLFKNVYLVLFPARDWLWNAL